MSGVLAGRRVLVVGLGVSGEAAAAAASGAGADVLAADSSDTEALRERAARLAALDVGVRLGTTGTGVLHGRDLVVASPGVGQSSPLLAAALAAGVDVWSEPELAWRLSGDRTRLVAVTGTNGKTSTTELLARCLAAPSAGNIGTPLSTVLAGDEPPGLLVVELSSFQLRFATTLAPEVAVLLNVAPDHLDWHGDLRAYGDAKARVWAPQGPRAWAVVNADDPGAVAVAERNPPPGRRASFTLAEPAPGQVGVRDGWVTARLPVAEAGVLPVGGLAHRAPHHLANALAATAAALCAGAGVEAVAAALGSYHPGPHRMEEVAVTGGVRWVDDSKATNPHAAAAALAAYDRVVWIAGGLNKGLDFAPLGPLLAERASAVVTVGAAAAEIGALARGLGLPVTDAGTVEAAVRAAAQLALPGDVVLLSPACASMDQFRDYAARGRAFRDAVAALGRRGDGVAR